MGQQLGLDQNTGSPYGITGSYARTAMYLCSGTAILKLLYGWFGLHATQPSRDKLRTAASLSSKTKGAGKGNKGRPHSQAVTYATYANFSSPIHRVLPHHVLAINRGEKAKALAVDVSIYSSTARRFSEWLVKRFGSGSSGGGGGGGIDQTWGEQLSVALEDGVQRLLLPSLTREWRAGLTEMAEAKSFGALESTTAANQLPPPARQPTGATYQPT